MADFSWTVFFVTVSFALIFWFSWLAYKAGPPDQE